MPARPRTSLAALAGCAALLGVAGCGQQPTPIVTVYSGDTSLYSDAAVFCFEGQDPGTEQGTDGACRYDLEASPKLLEVQPGDEVLVDVDKDLADAAWFVTLRSSENNGAGSSQGEVRVSTIQADSHTTTVQPDFSQGERQILTVRKLAGEREDAEVLGLWTFEVVPDV